MRLIKFLYTLLGCVLPYKKYCFVSEIQNLTLTKKNDALNHLWFGNFCDIKTITCYLTLTFNFNTFDFQFQSVLSVISHLLFIVSLLLNADKQFLKFSYRKKTQ